MSVGRTVALTPQQEDGIEEAATAKDLNYHMKWSEDLFYQ